MNTNLNSGHAKNLANLAVLIQLVQTIGASFNPGNPALAVTALLAMLKACEDTLTKVNDKLNAWKINTNLREIEFARFDDLISRLLGAIQSCNVQPQTLHDFNSLAKKVRGNSKLTKGDAGISAPEPGSTSNPGQPEANAKTHAASKQNFDGKIEIFAQMILLLKSEQYYQPNESGLTVANLETYLASLQAAHSAANLSWLELKEARIERNTAFYGETNGLLITARRVKGYLRSLLGAKSQQYKMALSIPFRRVVATKNAH